MPGIGDFAGRRQDICAPTGSTGRPFMPLITPAAEAHHATAAVMIPNQPPQQAYGRDRGRRSVRAQRGQATPTSFRLEL